LRFFSYFAPLKINNQTLYNEQRGVMAKRYLVPQHIEMEDKLVGPMTLMQFLYLLAGGIFSYGLLVSSLNRLISVPLALIVGSFFLAMAFFRINDQPFPKMLLAFLLYSIRPKERYWGKTQITESHLEKIETAGKQDNLKQLADRVIHHGWSGDYHLGDRVKSHKTILPHQQNEKKSP
jgi:hypothetical protein